MTQLLTPIVFSVLSFLVLTGPSLAQTNVVVPNARENSEAGGGNLFPFNCGFSNIAPSMRYQQIYSESQFPLVGLIDQISFRLDGSDLGFGPVTLLNVQIELSTTQTQPAAISSTFANNIGPDVQTVFSGDLDFPAIPDCVSGPCPFDVVIPLQSQFFYNPNDGNLLLDIRIPACVDLRPGESIGFDITGTNLFNSVLNRVTALNVNSATGNITNAGLVTQFRITQADQEFILAPITATNDVLTDHTVTATVEINDIPEPDLLVTFDVISGPNTGEISDPDSGECAPNDDCTTDANGQVSWTYTGSQVIGTDTIVASFFDERMQEDIESNEVQKIWEPPIRPIPTLSEWGLIAMAGLLGIIGFMVLRRKKITV